MLKGEVIDRPNSSRLMLMKEGDDPRIQKMIYIPINNGKFEYVLNCDYEETYWLVFQEEWRNGAMVPVKFIAEKGTINFTLYPTDQYFKNLFEGSITGKFKNHIIEGSKLNKELSDYDIEYSNYRELLFGTYSARRELLEKDGKYLTPEAQALENRYMTTDGEESRAAFDQYYQLTQKRLHLAPAGKALQESIDSANQVLLHWQLQYAMEHPNSVGYSILFEIFKAIGSVPPNDILPFADAYQTIFAPKYPDHPYTAKMIDLLTGSSLKPGIPFVDFTAIDFTGNPVKLSERIAGKPAVLHLWASWCGPCRRKGMELIPVYEEFKDKGFVVIGVAREKSISTAEAAVKQDKYPWENFVELDDVEQIWNKYGIGNAGGSDFLIDENGIIVAVAPSIDEIREFLKNR